MLKSYVEKHYCSNCIEVISLVHSNELLNRKCLDLKDDKSYLDQLMEFHKYNETIINIEMNKGIPVIVTLQIEHDYKCKIKSINLYAYKYDFIRKYIRVQELFTQISYSDELPRSISIIDFRGEMYNGYGSIVMNQFLSFIKTLKFASIKKVTGHLSLVDRDHWDMLYHFYQKFGFIITDDQHIILELSKGNSDETNNS